ncbi:hypothetical protein L3Y34_004813 [Caenorhabditis briggsae]|nr:hypothetical protein L3Y34_004813 [Caenorhabditis briggsae]
MATFFNKFFTGASSSAASSDCGNMDMLCQAINQLQTESHENVGERAADIVRQNKDLFEKKTADVEVFLTNCNAHVGSAAMAAAIKGLFDSSSSKNNEQGQERAVELIHHYLEENQLIGEHLKLVPEFIFPLIRSVGCYCMEKKHKPEIGQKIISKALATMYPPGGSHSNVLTSAHSVLFACALKTKDYSSVEPFVNIHIDEVANEKRVQDASLDEQFPTYSIARLKGSHKGQGPMSSLGNTNTPSPYLNPKFVLDYLYNGACVLIELKNYKGALFLLETLLSIPAYSAQDQIVEGYKKFVLVSLILNGVVVDNTDKLPGTRSLKLKTPEYKHLSEVKFNRSANTHAKVDELVQNAKDKLRRDGNLELAKLMVAEMRKKTIVALAKIFSSVRVSEIQKLAFLKNRNQVTDLIEQLVAENRINVTVEGEMVFWSEVAPVPSRHDILEKIAKVDHLNNLLQIKNKDMKSGSGRQKPSILYNEDEGLSMPPIE